MKYTQKKVVVLLMIVSSILCSTACIQQTNTNGLAICGPYAVPGMLCVDLKGHSYSCEILETDAENRTLYRYTAQNLIMDHQETVLVICQKIDSRFVYFYEDICYSSDSTEDTDIETLKAKNDWNYPLDEEKMSRRPIGVSFDQYLIMDNQLDYGQILSRICKEADILSAQIIELGILDYDSCGHELYYLSFEQSGTISKYLLIVDANYELSFLELENDIIDILELLQLKHDSGWRYGF